MWEALDKAIQVDGWKLILLLRMSPLVPYNVMNVLLGSSGIHFSTFVFFSTIGPCCCCCCCVRPLKWLPVIVPHRLPSCFAYNKASFQLIASSYSRMPIFTPTPFPPPSGLLPVARNHPRVHDPFGSEPQPSNHPSYPE